MIDKAKEENFVRKILCKKMFLRIILIFIIIMNCTVIFNFSSQQSEQSNKTSGVVVDKIVETNPRTRNLEKKEKEKVKEKIVTPVRKTAHFTAYMSLGIWIYLCSMTFGGLEDENEDENEVKVEVQNETREKDKKENESEDENRNKFLSKSKIRVLSSVIFAFLYACSDEIHQLFVSGRSGEFRDVCIDTCGASFGILIVWCITRVVRKISSSIKNSEEKRKIKGE